MGKKNESKMGTSQATFYVKKTNATSVVCDVDVGQSKKKEQEAETVHDPSLSRMLRCRKNLKPSHKRVTDEKQKSVLIDSLSNPCVQFRPQRDLFCMQPQGQSSLSGNHEEEDLVCVGGQIMTTSQLIRVLDPWISPYSPSDRKKMLEDASTQVKTRSIRNSFRGESSNIFPSSSINHSMYPTASPQTLSNPPFNYPIQGQPMFQNQPTYWSSPPEMGMQCTPLLGIPVQHYTQMTGPDLDPNFYCAQNLNWVPTEAERFPYLENYQPSFNTAVTANTYNTFYDASDEYPSNSTQVDLPEIEFVFPDGFFIEDQNENVALQTFNTLYDPNEVPSNFTQVDLPENESFSLDDLFITFSEDENEIGALDTEGNVDDDPLDWDGFHLAETLNSSDLNFILNS